MKLRDIVSSLTGINYFSFLGGIQISAIINLYTELYLLNFLTINLIFIVIASIFMFCGGYLSMLLAWESTKIIKEGEKAVGTLYPPEKLMNDYLDAELKIFKYKFRKITKLRIYFYSNVTITVTGIVFFIMAQIDFQLLFIKMVKNLLYLFFQFFIDMFPLLELF